MPDFDDVLVSLSKKLIKLTGNDLINKRIPGAGVNQIFNVYDEVPELVINNLLGTEKKSGGDLRIAPIKVDDEYLKDERTRNFKAKLNELLRSEKIDTPDDLEEDQLRDFKNNARKALGLPKIEELIPDRNIILPKLIDDHSTRHTDRILQTDVPDKNYDALLKGIVKKAQSIEREKGIETLYLAFGILSWDYERTQFDNASYNSPVILLPIQMVFKNGNYHLSSSTGEIYLNPHLNAALEQVLGNPLPSFNPEKSKKSVGEYTGYYFSKLGDYLKKTNLKNWDLVRRICGGVFMSSGISPEELNPNNYDTDSKTRMHEWLAGSDGMPQTLRNYEVDTPNHRKRVPAVSLPADSSQHSAVVDASMGSSFYIQGPPGTGKSQTIVNIIANALLHGKRVLFLAQKTAALNVVYERLSAIGLQKKCIPLHSDYTIKSALFTNLAIHIEPSRDTQLNQKKFDDAVSRRDEIIDRLNAYTNFLKTHEGGEKDGLSNHDILVTHSIYGKSIFLKNECVFTKHLTFKNINETTRILSEIINNLGDCNQEILDGFLNFRPEKIPTRFEIDEIEQQSHNCLQSLIKIQQELHVWSVSDFEKDINRYTDGLRTSGEHDQILSELEGITVDYEKLSEESIADDLETLEQSSFLKNIFSKEIKSLILKYKKLFKENALKQKDVITKLDYLKIKLVERKSLGAKLHEVKCNDYTTEQISQILEILQNSLNDFQNSLRFYYQLGFKGEVTNVDFLKRKLTLIANNGTRLESFGKVSHLKQKIGDYCSADEFINEVLRSGCDLKKEFCIRLYYEAAKKLLGEWVDLEGSIPTGKDISKLRSELKDAEASVSKVYNIYLASLNPDLTDVEQGNAVRVKDKTGLSLLKHLAATPKARVTLREMIQRSGEALNTIAPCFLTTPSSVSELIPRSMSFDMCIIDEASQMLVEEASGSMLRSKQVIVVGDQKQMAPTNYMTSSVADKEENQVTEKNESILDRCVSALGKLRRLQYHYRSQDDSLIHFSNVKFYDNDLMIPPTCSKNQDFGVSQIKLEKAKYNPGGGVVKSKNPNPIEAEKIVDLIEEQIANNPTDSIGVAVLNLKQTIRINELWEERLSKSKKLQTYVDKFSTSNEYFFIKNLENVQGDERDSIIIGTVFGKTEEGVVPQNFGPINQDLGPNRINVLITRAKKRLIVCTSLDPVDITSKTQGMQILRDFLAYSKNGAMLMANTPLEENYDSPWEKWFKERLETDGFEVDPQVGVSKFRIDLGVKHKDCKNGYLCGIELDGAAYHLEPSARERDHCRQSILESKGWTILRVWSTDFFSDQEGTYQSLKDQLLSLLDSQKEDCGGLEVA
jgi:very-short-patch-repair endonuclease